MPTESAKDSTLPTDKPVVRPASDVIARQLGDAAVLIRMRTSKIYELNATGARIWESLKAGSDREQVIDQLLSEFDIARPDAEAAVDELIGALQAEGLV